MRNVVHIDTRKTVGAVSINRALDLAINSLCRLEETATKNAIDDLSRPAMRARWELEVIKRYLGL